MSASVSGCSVLMLIVLLGLVCGVTLCAVIRELWP